MKTVLEWFKTLPAKQSEEAIDNTSHNQLRLPAVNLSKALVGAFVWETTPQKRAYWNDIHIMAEEIERKEANKA